MSGIASTKGYRTVMMGLRVVGGLCGIAVIILGIIGFLTITLDPRVVINNAYRIIFGTLMIICELRITSLLRHFFFLQHFLGLGLFYIFVGGILLASQWYYFLVAAVVFAVGISYCVLGLMCHRMNQEEFELMRREAAMRRAAASGTAPTNEMATTAGGLAGQDANAQNVTLEEKNDSVWGSDPNYKRESAYGGENNTAPSWHERALTAAAGEAAGAVVTAAVPVAVEQAKQQVRNEYGKKRSAYDQDDDGTNPFK